MAATLPAGGLHVVEQRELFDLTGVPVATPGPVGFGAVSLSCVSDSLAAGAAAAP